MSDMLSVSFEFFPPRTEEGDLKLDKTIEDINISFKKYRISEALMITYKFVWDDFCSLYLEIVKPEYGNIYICC
jgi:hypothetical protein